MMGGWRASYAMRRHGLGTSTQWAPKGTLTVDVEILEGRRPQAHRDAAHSREPSALKDLDVEYLQHRAPLHPSGGTAEWPLCGRISAQVREIWTNRGTQPRTKVTRIQGLWPGVTYTHVTKPLDTMPT